MMPRGPQEEQFRIRGNVRSPELMTPEVLREIFKKNRKKDLHYSALTMINKDSVELEGSK